MTTCHIIFASLCKKDLTFRQVEGIGFFQTVKKPARLFRIRRRDYAAQYILPFGS